MLNISMLEGRAESNDLPPEERRSDDITPTEMLTKLTRRAILKNLRITKHVVTGK